MRGFFVEHIDNKSGTINHVQSLNQTALIKGNKMLDMFQIHIKMDVNIPLNPDKMSSVPFVVFQYKLDESKLSLIFLIIDEGEQMLFSYFIYTDLLHYKYSDTDIVIHHFTSASKPLI